MVSAHQSVGATKIVKLAENLKLTYRSAAQPMPSVYHIELRKTSITQVLDQTYF
jgi:hypothetical protein